VSDLVDHRNNDFLSDSTGWTELELGALLSLVAEPPLVRSEVTEGNRRLVVDLCAVSPRCARVQNDLDVLATGQRPSEARETRLHRPKGLDGTLGTLVTILGRRYRGFLGKHVLCHLYTTSIRGNS
jgi:hypothetical protein